MTPIERRRYRRIYFSPEDEVVATIILGGAKLTRIAAHVLNICMIGMAVSPKVECPGLLRVGDHVVMDEIKGRLPINFKGKVKLQVRWAKELPELDRFGIGLEILETPIQFTDIIGKLIYG